MKIKVKTLQGLHFEIEADSDDTVDGVKQKIENARDVYPKARQMLFFRGKVLKDGTTLDENEVVDNSFIVVMLGRKDIESSPGEGSSNTAATTTKVPRTGAQPPSNALPYGPRQAASNLLTGNDWEQTVQQIIDMGRGSWDRTTVVNALHVSRSNPLLAFAYFLACVPEDPSVSPSPAQSQPAPALSSGPNTTPLDLFPRNIRVITHVDQLRNDPQFQELRAAVQARPQKLQLTLHKLKKGNPTLMRKIRAHPIDFLTLMNETASPSKQVDSAVLQSNAVTPNQDRAATDRVDSAVLEPNAVIPDQDRATIDRVDSAALQSNAVAPKDRPANDRVDSAALQSNAVTPEDRQAIARLEARGFRRATVSRVYFACDRDEDRALTYLSDHHMDELEE